MTLKTNFDTYSRILKKAIRNAKSSFYEREFNKHKNNMTKTWKSINNILNRNNKSEFPDYIETQNGKISDKQIIVHHLNDFFSTIGEKLSSKLPKTNNFNIYLRDQLAYSFSFQRTNSNSITKIIRGMKPKSSSGPDQLSVKLLKAIESCISGPISLLVNQSLSTGIFPQKFKIAKVVPLLKKPNCFVIDNFRPVSLLPVISKIVEKIVFNQLFKYFTENKLFYISQYGYRIAHSTETACLELVDRTTQLLDEKKLPLSVFIDLTKAFDTIDHEILIKKLQHYGIKDLALSWFQNYLNNRMQYVQIENFKSSVNPITTGVPQGSILGPLLFIIYVNDINTISRKFSCILYADDTSLCTTICAHQQHPNGKDISQNINKELQLVYEWLTANKLSLNVAKTKYMLFHHPQLHRNRIPNLTLKINGTPIEKVTSFNFLGLTISETMSWYNHVEKISLKISKTVGVLCRLKNFLHKSILLKVYNSLIIPHLHYCVLCWGREKNRVLKIQKKCVRILCNAKFNAHTDPLFRKLGLLKIQDIFDIQCVKFFYKFRNNTLPGYFNTFFTINENIHGHNTRQIEHVHLYRYRTNINKNQIRHFIPNLINNLSGEIRNKIATHSITSVTSALKKMYIEKYELNCTLVRCYVCNRR
jgi:hypothetical protein